MSAAIVIDASNERANDSQKQFLLKPKTRPPRNRAGSPNYAEEEIPLLLDIAEGVEPLGANEWAFVAD